jgi:hypothetical protein
VQVLRDFQSVVPQAELAGAATPEIGVSSISGAEGDSDWGGAAIEASGRSLMRKIVLNPPCDGDQSTHQRRAHSDAVKQSRAAGLLDRNLNLNLDRVTF